MSRVRRERNSGHRLWLLFIVLFGVFCLVFFSARGRFQVPMAENTVMLVLAPFERAVSYGGAMITELKTFVWNVYTVHEQNEQLKKEIAELRAQNVAAAEYAAENERLRALVDYKQSATQFDILVGRVIGREAANWSRSIVINRGTADGVADNMTVITEKGLVGHITEAGLISSKVQLILDPRSSVGTLVQRPDSRIAGIVEGDPDNPTAPRMVNIPRNADVVEGNQIVTSGFGGVYPKGIVVGRIAALKNDPGGLLKYGVVESAVDFQKLEDVAVIVNSREAPPDPLPPTDPATGAPTKTKEANK